MGKQSWKAGNMLNPVPAVMVSVADQNHRPNIITVAWAGTVCTNPPMVSISVRPSRYSYEIIEKTGEFVINLTNEKLAKACDYCGVVSGRDVDKFKKTGLTPVPVEHVKAPAIAESPVNIACRVVESHPLGSHTMFVAEVPGLSCIPTENILLWEKNSANLDTAYRKRKNDTRLIVAACPSVQHIHLHFSFSSYCRWLLPVLL